MSPKLSVVVPIYDVEEYLQPLLDSIAAQTLTDLEVIMVDDGSTDGSGVIAKAMAERDPRFRLVQQANAGLGPARNTGARVAAGQYLVFADSDDLIPPDAYKTLVSTLERTGSDVATGNVQRLEEDRLSPSSLHRPVFGERREGIRLMSHPPLMRDITAWNKVFRRSFWDAHRFEFPSGLYEDSPVTLKAHALAAAVDVLPDIVYIWRKREGSITKHRAEYDNLVQRLRMAASVRNMLGALDKRFLTEFDRHVLLDVHMGVLFTGIAQSDPSLAESLVRLGGDIAGRVDAKLRAELPAIARLRLHLLIAGKAERLLDVLNYQFDDAPVYQKGRRWYAEYPYYGDEPASCFDVTEELKAITRIDRMHWVNDRLKVEGHAYIRHLDAAPSRIRLWLVAPSRAGMRRIPITRVDRPDITAGSGQSAACLDASGFTAEIPAQTLRHLGRFRPMDWTFMVDISNQGVRRLRSVGFPRTSPYRWPAELSLPGDLRVQPRAGGDRSVLRISARGPRLTAQHRDGDMLVLEGVGSGGSLVATAGKRKIKATPLWDGTRFRAELPLCELAGEPAWTCAVGGRPLESGDVSDAGHALVGVEVAVTRTDQSTVRLVTRTAVPLVHELRWDVNGALRLHGEYRGRERPTCLVLRRRRSNEEHFVPLRWDGALFDAVLWPARMPLPGQDVPLGAGSWTLQLEAETTLPVQMARSALHALPDPCIVDLHEYTVAVRDDDGLQLKVVTALGAGERGRYAQSALRRSYYPRQRELPARDVALFDSYGGHQFSCNPRGLFNELVRMDTELDLVWVTRDGRFATPQGARTVLAGTAEHYELLARARLLVGNLGQEPWFRKREGQTYVQTWHGTPLKPINELPYDPGQWDLLLAQNSYSVPLFRNAFGYHGPILESGYPRNDLLFHGDPAAVRQRLGIADGKKVVLYAPTWRADLKSGPGRYGFRLDLDLDRLASALGDDHVILFRTHHLITDRPGWRPGASIVDVTGYPDIADLYLVADVLVTDHSSAMFDFAVTGKPMLFHSHDLERQSLTLDLEAEAPGPVLRTTDEVIDALRYPPAPAGTYRAFVDRYCPHDDGRAAERVIAYLQDQLGEEIPCRK